MSTVLVALILLLVMIVFLAIGAWIPVAIAVTSWVGLVVFSDHDALVNLANKNYYITRSGGNFGLITAAVGEPRTFGATFRVKL